VKLELAEYIAGAIVKRLLVCAVRVAVAGSIRRRRPEVRDIDLVAIPTLVALRSDLLFEEAREEPKNSELVTAFCLFFGTGQRGSIEARGNDIVRARLSAAGLLDLADEAFDVPAEIIARPVSIGVDLYLATPETWATTLLIRTGSKEHNIWLCERARRLGGKLHASGQGLELPGEYDPLAQRSGPPRKVIPQTEDEIFKALCAREFNGGGVPPALREIVNGRPAWLPQEAS
jgi:hypothetical protein